MIIHFVCGNDISVKEKDLEECDPLGSVAFYVTRTKDGSKTIVITANICWIEFK